ncbi:MAG: hypothetical protein P8Z40_15635 [Chloroflexota bacterium]
MLPHKVYPLVGFVFVCVAFCFPSVARADAAPPQAPPGSTIATNDFETNVQMVSEEVVIDVEDYHGPAISLVEGQAVDEGYVESPQSSSNTVLSNGDMVGHVTATFSMLNHGDEPESFDVWFPIGANDGYFNIVTVVNFQAWVNGNLVETGRRETEGEFGDVLPWATWPVDFPVDEQVELMVTYDLPATFEFQRYRFDYVLETGSGWWGVIESGTFIFRFPYDVTAENVSLSTFNLGDIPIDTLDVSGQEMRWSFRGLEPDRGDNIQLRVLGPSVWEEILAARAEVDANPDSAEVQLRLAHALTAAMGFKYGVVSGESFVPEAVQAYEQALALAPDDVETYVDYLDFLVMMAEPVGPLPDRFEPVLRQALAIAPNDERLLQWQEYVEQREGFWATSTPTPLTMPTPTPTAQPEVATISTPTPTALPPIGEETVDTPAPLTQESRGFPFPVVTVVLCAGLALAVLIVAAVVVVVVVTLRGRSGGGNS